MSPQHMAHVVEAAWLLVALLFRLEDACAAAVQVSAHKHCGGLLLQNEQL